MGGYSRSAHVLGVDQIINMTSDPIRIYNDVTGEIVSFFPSARTYCSSCFLDRDDVFPAKVCYVFERGDERLERFYEKMPLVAIIASRGTGRGGVEIVSLETIDRKKRVLFRKKTA